MAVRGGTNHCDVPAEHHGLIFEFVADVLSIKAVTLCCTRHLPAMRLSTHLDHELTSACGLPGSVIEWDHGQSWCHMPPETWLFEVARDERLVSP